ncbi:uncharacterized protein JCM10292_007521 [Rhodotorula paludigena]|uniref:uncharacterized protein n=1 Tax=Rhodotorula paludigena TaxID=86838 RepID=UPI00316BCDFC
MRNTRPAESLYFSTSMPPALACLNLPDSEAYLERIGLPASLAADPPSLELLSRILMAHMCTVPYDSSAIHVPREAWKADEAREIRWREGPGMELGCGNFERVVLRRQGGYCFALNQLAASFLRGFGFRVSEVGARVFLHRGKDPKEHGYWWSQTTHMALIVDWDGGECRWFADFGFGGGGCPNPILLRDGATSLSLSKSESFLLKEEPMPLGELVSTTHDAYPGWTLYRRVVDAGVVIRSAEEAHRIKGHWTPCIHFTLATIAPEDVTMGDFFNSRHEQAPWANIFLISLLLPNGARRSLCHGIPAIEAGAPQDGHKYAKVYTKEGIKGEEYDVEWVPYNTQAMRRVLQRDFGFLLDGP